MAAATARNCRVRTPQRIRLRLNYPKGQGRSEGGFRLYIDRKEQHETYFSQWNSLRGDDSDRCYIYTRNSGEQYALARGDHEAWRRSLVHR